MAEDRPLQLIGKPFRRVDGRAKVTGQTLFADDLVFPRMAFMRLVRSTVPHALIRSDRTEEPRLLARGFEQRDLQVRPHDREDDARQPPAAAHVPSRSALPFGCQSGNCFFRRRRGD